MSIVLVCEIGDRAAHVYIHSEGHKLLEKAAPRLLLIKIK